MRRTILVTTLSSSKASLDCSTVEPKQEATKDGSSCSYIAQGASYSVTSRVVCELTVRLAKLVYIKPPNGNSRATPMERKLAASEFRDVAYCHCIAVMDIQSQN
jgi:hypothetical protein